MSSHRLVTLLGLVALTAMASMPGCGDETEAGCNDDDCELGAYCNDEGVCECQNAGECVSESGDDSATSGVGGAGGSGGAGGGS